MKSQSVVLAFLSIATSSLVAPTGQSRVLAIHGTTSVLSQSQVNWTEYAVGGIQNRDTASRNWLLPLNIYLDGPCTDIDPGPGTDGICGVKATIKGGPAGGSTAIAYAVSKEGAFTGASTVLVAQGNSLATKDLGAISVPADGHVLLVANLVRATTIFGTDGGAMTSASLYRP